MGLLIGLLIRIITFPGIIFDAIINNLVCQHLEIKVNKINYLAIFGGNAVEIENPNNYSKLFKLSIIPFIFMTILALPFSYLAAYYNEGDKFLFFAWLGVSIAAHAFPETAIGKLLWEQSKIEIKEKNYLAIFGFPLVVIIYLFRILHVLWLDIIYGIGIIYFLQEYIIK